MFISEIICQKLSYEGENWSCYESKRLNKGRDQGIGARDLDLCTQMVGVDIVTRFMMDYQSKEQFPNHCQKSCFVDPAKKSLFMQTSEYLLV